jgi:hypothetical protein
MKRHLGAFVIAAHVPFSYYSRKWVSGPRSPLYRFNGEPPVTALTIIPHPLLEPSLRQRDVV